MASAEEVHDLKARVSPALLARDDVRLVGIAQNGENDYALRVGVSSPDAPEQFSDDLKRALAGQPVTYEVVEPFRKF